MRIEVGCGIRNAIAQTARRAGAAFFEIRVIATQRIVGAAGQADRIRSCPRGSRQVYDAY